LVQITFNQPIRPTLPITLAIRYLYEFKIRLGRFWWVLVSFGKTTHLYSRDCKSVLYGVITQRAVQLSFAQIKILRNNTGNLVTYTLYVCKLRTD